MTEPKSHLFRKKLNLILNIQIFLGIKKRYQGCYGEAAGKTEKPARNSETAPVRNIRDLMEGYIDKDIRLAILGRPEESYLEKIKSYFRENYPGEASIWDLRDDWDRICPITPSQE